MAAIQPADVRRCRNRRTRDRAQGAARGLARFGADAFLDRQCGRGPALPASRRAGSGEYAVRRPVHLHPEHRTAHEVGLSYGARSGFTRGSVPGEFAIRSFAQTQDTGKALDLALQTLAQLKSGARDGRDAGFRARLCAGPVSARLRDGGGLGRRPWARSSSTAWAPGTSRTTARNCRR